MNSHEDEMALEASQFYTGLYGEMAAEETGGGEKKARRRRRKGKGGNGETSEGARKRKLSNDQVKMLEENFGSEHKLESERKDKLASQLGLDSRQVAVWFQNRRARWKTKKLEEEYSKLKNSHDQLLLSKCHLESEVFKLKEKLDEAEKAMQQQLSFERSDVVSSNSPHSTLTMETMDQPFLGEFGTQGFCEDVFYVPENNYNNNGMEWVNSFYYM